MSTGTIIIGMLGAGVVAAVGEKVLNSFGKPEMANFINIAGLCGIGLSGIALVVELVKMLSSLI